MATEIARKKPTIDDCIGAIKQYDRISGRIPGETQSRFYYGTFSNPENIEALVYYALTLHNPQLASTNRVEVIRAIKSLPSNLSQYFQSIGLSGVMWALFIKERGKVSIPLAVLVVFDNAYKKRAKDVSLFSKTQEPHIEVYWQNI